jgi:squalene-hopene/tetraprenyl-beta-curcumene cyclase
MNEAFQNVKERLLSELLPEGRWEGELSSSALATAVASFALKSAGRTELAERGFQWLEENRNADGGWGDSPESPSNFTTTLLCRCVLDKAIGSPQEVADSILNHYGDDRTFSVPILTMCMLTGKLGRDWAVIPQLPFELAAIPHRFYKVVRLPVVSYALPALIAIGLVRHVHRPSTIAFWRNALIPRVLNILQTIQPESGGYIEAMPLTGFVAMSLIGAGYGDHPVTRSCIRFLEDTVRDDGSWPIDVNLSTWVTSLATCALVNELSEEQKNRIRSYLLKTQWKAIHPFTKAEPGGWAWTHEQGGVPDADDTSAALLALKSVGCDTAVAEQGIRWLLNLQNRDGGFPTFCKGWGRLPFDRSCPDLTAHAIRAFNAWRGEVESSLWKQMKPSMARAFQYLEREQRSDGSWVPLWFGNQHNENHETPVYGTVRVLEALSGMDHPMVKKGFQWLKRLEMDALCLEELALVTGLTGRGGEQLAKMTSNGTEFPASPIGLYFASLWYSEKLYPVIFSAEGFKRCGQVAGKHRS